MPRILIDVTRLLYRRVTGMLPTGIDRLSQSYAAHYAGARAVLSLGPFSVVLSAADSRAVFADVSEGSPSPRRLAARVALKAALWRWMALGVRGDILVNNGHTGLENPHYGWWLRRRGARMVAILHDLIPITHPQFVRPGEPEVHRTRMACAARHCTAIVANSKHTLAEFRSYCRSAALPSPPAVVAYPAAGVRGEPDPRPPIPEPYFLMLATLEPRKNHATMLHVWRDLVRDMGAAAPKLVIIGQVGWNSTQVLKLLAASGLPGECVIEKRSCGDAELATWFAHARALLFPSLAEGYGMPMNEAMSRGVPVLASDLPVFHETVGGVPDYAAPLDTQRWGELVRDYARPDSALRAAQLGRMRDFRPATWAHHFSIVDELIANLDDEAWIGRHCVD